MNAHELIEQLKTYPPWAPVVVCVAPQPDEYGEVSSHKDDYTRQPATVQFDTRTNLVEIYY